MFSSKNERGTGGHVMARASTAISRKFSTCDNERWRETDRKIKRSDALPQHCVRIWSDHENEKGKEVLTFHDTIHARVTDSIDTMLLARGLSRYCEQRATRRPDRAPHNCSFTIHRFYWLVRSRRTPSLVYSKRCMHRGHS